MDPTLFHMGVKLLLMGATQYNYNKPATETLCIDSVPQLSMHQWLECFQAVISSVVDGAAAGLARRAGKVTGQVGVTGDCLMLKWNRHVIEAIRRYYKASVDDSYSFSVKHNQLALTSDWVVFRMECDGGVNTSPQARMRAFSPRFQEYLPMVGEFPGMSFETEDGDYFDHFRRVRRTTNQVLWDVAMAVGRKAYLTMLENSIDGRVGSGWTFQDSMDKVVLMCALPAGIPIDQCELEVSKRMICVPCVICDLLTFILSHFVKQESMLDEVGGLYHLLDYVDRQLGYVPMFAYGTFEIWIVEKEEGGGVPLVYLKMKRV